MYRPALGWLRGVRWILAPYHARRADASKRRFEIRPRPMPTIETARRDGRPTGRYCLSAGRDGGTTCLLSLTRHIGFLQLDDGVTQRFHPM